MPPSEQMNAVGFSRWNFLHRQKSTGMKLAEVDYLDQQNPRSRRKRPAQSRLRLNWPKERQRARNWRTHSAKAIGTGSPEPKKSCNRSETLATHRRSSPAEPHNSTNRTFCEFKERASPYDLVQSVAQNSSSTAPPPGLAMN